MVKYNRQRRYGEQAGYALSSLYEGAGYKLYKMKKFEKYELYAEYRSFLQDGNVITFSDMHGKLLALKPDVTLSIAKNSKSDGRSKKLYYDENVYRLSRQTKEYTEIPQIGVELIGKLDTYSICEIVDLAAQSLDVLSDDSIMEISHMGFVKAFLSEFDLDEGKTAELLEAIGKKAGHTCKQLCEKFGLSERDGADIASLASMYGEFSATLEKSRVLCRNREMENALSQLSQIGEILGENRRLMLDFSVINDIGYYDGVIFRGYISSSHKAVLSGGQYGALMKKLGKDDDAVGFAVYMDALEGEKIKTNDVDVLLVYGGKAPAEVFACAKKLREQGKSVLVSKYGDEEVSYGEKVIL